jgi:hypothetical protein
MIPHPKPHHTTSHHDTPSIPYPAVLFWHSEPRGCASTTWQSQRSFLFKESCCCHCRCLEMRLEGTAQSVGRLGHGSGDAVDGHVRLSCAHCNTKGNQSTAKKKLHSTNPLSLPLHTRPWYQITRPPRPLKTHASQTPPQSTPTTSSPTPRPAPTYSPSSSGPQAYNTPH